MEDESVEATQIYLDANLALKEDALKKTSPVNVSVGQFKPDDQLLSFLRTFRTVDYARENQATPAQIAEWTDSKNAVSKTHTA